MLRGCCTPQSHRHTHKVRSASLYQTFKTCDDKQMQKVPTVSADKIAFPGCRSLWELFYCPKEAPEAQVRLRMPSCTGP